MYIDILRYPRERRRATLSLLYTVLRKERNAWERYAAVAMALEEYVGETRGRLDRRSDQEIGWNDLFRMREHFLVELRSHATFGLGELVFAGLIFSSRYPNAIFEGLMEVDREVYENPYLAIPEFLMDRYRDSRLAEERLWLLFILDGLVGTAFSRFAEAPESPVERRIIIRHYRNLERIAEFVRTTATSEAILTAPGFLANLACLVTREDWRRKR